MECKCDDDSLFGHDEKVRVGEGGGDDRRAEIEWNVLNLVNPFQQADRHGRHLRAGAMERRLRGKGKERGTDLRDERNDKWGGKNT